VRTWSWSLFTVKVYLVSSEEGAVSAATSNASAGSHLVDSSKILVRSG
jgi:hypothetical protein